MTPLSDLNDRVALMLGRAAIRMEELAIQLEVAQARISELEKELSQPGEASSASPSQAT